MGKSWPREFSRTENISYFPGTPGFLSKFPKKLTLIFQSLEPSLFLMKSGSYSYRCECQNSDNSENGGGSCPGVCEDFFCFPRLVASQILGIGNWGFVHLGRCSQRMKRNTMNQEWRLLSIWVALFCLFFSFFNN